MLGAGYPVPPPETTSTGLVFPLLVALAAAIVVTALILWSARTSRAPSEGFVQLSDRGYDEAA